MLCASRAGSPPEPEAALDHPLGVTRRAASVPSIAGAMPVAVHITPRNMSRDDYERVIAELDASGAGEPEGRLFHAAYGTDEVHMFEVWDSPDQFDAHSNQLFAVIQGAGVDAGTVNVHPLHSPHPD
jgi:quinol monooxygenase YgiN